MMSNNVKRLLWSLDIDVKRMSSASTFEANMMSIIKHRNVDLVLDVGANVGQFGKMLRSLGYTGEIISYEPNPEVFPNLEKLMSADANWNGSCIALSEEDGELLFRKYNYSVLSSFYELNDEGRHKFPGAEELGVIPVKVSRLDEVLDASALQGKSILLKTDTQGFDVQVFRGATGIFDSIVALVCELSLQNLYSAGSDWLEAIEIYRASGFILSGIYPVSRNERLELLEANAIFVRGTAESVPEGRDR